MISARILLSSELKVNCLCSFNRYIRKFPNVITSTRKIDPGVRKRATLLDNHDLEAIEELESDFLNIGLSHKEYTNEVTAYKEQQKYQIVRQKYFKEKSPNFLTWSDKEQIRFLHKTNPDEWTIEKLSEGFPALPGTIQKIIKSIWTKKTEGKIKNHDESVQSNWAQFKEGKLNLAPHVAEHLNKFTKRDLTLKNFEIPYNMKNQVEGEFSEIIKSYNRLNDKRNNTLNTVNLVKNRNSIEKAASQDTRLLSKYIDHNKNIVTLSVLKEQIETRAVKGKMLNEDDKIILSKIKSESTKEDDAKNENPIVDLDTVKFKTTSQIATMKTIKDYAHLKYPEKITIPKHKVKRGFTYKLNDCYYDYDGLFLYRVPGMDK